MDKDIGTGHLWKDGSDRSNYRKYERSREGADITDS